ncbi:MAG: nucleoside permease [Fluviicola sp.]|nr:nucleoside permease [Fluviicola sp.]
MQLSIKNRLIFMSFMQFFVWGAWLITIYNFWFETKEWGGAEFGAVFTTLGLSSLFMPTITGIIADKWLNAEKLYGLLHIIGGITLCTLPFINDPNTFFWVILVAMLCYMPTISLSNSVGYTILKNNNYDVVKTFPPIRVWGTIGFIAAMWFVNLTGNKASSNQFIISGISAIFLGIYSFTLPKCKPTNIVNSSLSKALGLDAFKLFADYKLFLFFMFSLLLGAALQLTNMYGDGYIGEFGKFAEFQNSLIVKYSTVVMSISQISETLFILAIPFFLKRFGIKKVMLMSMIAWVLRFGLLAYGNPTDGLWMIIVSCIVYGMAFDFFNVSGSLFIETSTKPTIRSSAQGLFMMMTNGVGAIIGSLASAKIIGAFFTLTFKTKAELANYLGHNENSSAFKEIIKKAAINSDGSFKTPVTMNDWQPIWLTFAAYSLVVAVLFAILFRHKHDPLALGEVKH